MVKENGISRREFLTGAILIPLGASKLLAEQGAKIDLVMKEGEAAKYLNEQIHPRLMRVLNDPNQVPGISNRLRDILIQTQANGKISYAAIGGYNPIAINSDAHMDWDPTRKKPVLMAFVPALQRDISKLEKEGYGSKEIDLAIAIIYAHEEVHYELTEVKKKYPSLAVRYTRNSTLDINLDTLQEAEAWGITVLEMIRPALARGSHLTKNFIQTSETFKKFGDNYSSPEWINTFRNYGK